MTDIETGNQSHSSNANPISETQNAYDEKINKFELYKAALSNDWKKAETVYRSARMKYGVEITSRGETALHVAALAGHTEFVQNLVQKMNAEEIRTETKPVESGKGNTAFHCAVISGNVKIAKAILATANDLAMAKGVGNNLPINMAAEKGNKEMVRYLYDFTRKKHPEALNSRNEDNETLFLSLIKSNIFDIALLLAKVLFHEKETPYEVVEDALEELSVKPLNLPGLLDRCIHSFSYSKAVVMHENAVELVELLWNSLTLDEERVTAFINSPDPNPIIEAAKRGNFRFLSIIISSYPDALFTRDHHKHTIIHHAILNRHVDIFKFIHIGSAKTIVTMYRDHEGNNMLHLAAKLPLPIQLNIVPGAALQLQRELLWFEEVKKVMEPHEVNRKKYDLRDFPQDKMLLLVEAMKTIVCGVGFEDGLFKSLRKVFEQQIGKLKEYHPSSQGQPDMKNSMNQSDLVLLFKKLKKVMERGHDDELGHIKLISTFFSHLEDIGRFNVQNNADREDLFETFWKMERLVENLHELQELAPHMLGILELQQLNEEIDKLWHNPSGLRDEDIIEFARGYLQEIKSSSKPEFWRLKIVFEEMEKIMEQHIDTLMAAEYTPHDVFVKEHENLMEKGEKWMRDTANSCLIVAVLITTIAFAAAITVPGGNSDNGYPNFSSEILFKAFAIADSISMISSAVSLLNFLSILTARYTIDNFRWSLPNKLFIGLFAIFISVVAMMVAYVLSIFIIFKSSPSSFSILIAAASFVPIALFLLQHSGLFVDVFRSTYASHFLFKPKNDPSSVFKRTSSSDVELKKTN